jgi:hypothetical protein
MKSPLEPLLRLFNLSLLCGSSMLVPAKQRTEWGEGVEGGTVACEAYMHTHAQYFVVC